MQRCAACEGRADIIAPPPTPTPPARPTPTPCARARLDGWSVHASRLPACLPRARCQRNLEFARCTVPPSAVLPPPPRAPALQVFCASDSTAHEEMRQACFDYLALGGIYSGEPVAAG